jgi:hypothetical protein
VFTLGLFYRKGKKMRSVRDFFVFDLICDGKEIATPISVSCQCSSACVPVHRCTAIWDTGATSSMISEKLARKLNLTPEGTVKVSGVHGIEESNIYTIQLQFNNGFTLNDIQVSEAGNNAGFDILIGMDIIAKGIFIVDGVNHAPNSCQIAFALPLDK